MEFKLTVDGDKMWSRCEEGGKPRERIRQELGYWAASHGYPPQRKLDVLGKKIVNWY
jgi:hypothetical protein